MREIFYIEEMTRNKIQIGVVFMWKVQGILIKMTEIRFGFLIIIESVDGILFLRQQIFLLHLLWLFLL